MSEGREGRREKSRGEVTGAGGVGEAVRKGVALLPAAPLPVSRETPFRATGDVAFSVWEREFAQAGSTLTGEALRACYDAAQGVSALVLDRFGAESGYATTSPAGNNYLGLREPESLAFMAFGTPVDGVQELIRRWTDAAYKPSRPGVYMPQALSLAEMLRRYSPPNENDTEALIRGAVERINRWRAEGGEAAAGGINWAPLAYPPMRLAIVSKPAEGAGFYRVAPRWPRIVGCCNHITDGDPGGDAIEWYRAFFSTGGERAWDALVDTVIARDGEIGLLNDPRDVNRGGTRAGWANGTVDGLEGEGVAFYQHYPAINDVLWSKEHVARSGQALTDAQMEASIQLSAAVAHNSGCPWDSYPRNATKSNVVIEQEHANFALKACPDWWFIEHFRPVLRREVKAILTKQQTGSTNPGTPPPAISPPSPPPLEGGVSPVAEPSYPFGFTREAIDFFFGTLTRYDGATFGFDPAGPISLLWLARCREEGKFPEAESWSLFGGRDVVQWEGGWMAIRDGGGADPKAVWSWIDTGAPSPRVGDGVMG
jgi:hypothetical protein